MNAQLSNAYAGLFGRLDLRLVRRAPDLDCILSWRAEQEAKLQRVSRHALPAMDEAALRRFIAHYERLTRWLLADEPAHLIVDLDRDRTLIGWRERAGPF